MEEMVLISTKAIDTQATAKNEEFQQHLTIQSDGSVLFKAYYVDLASVDNQSLARMIHKKIDLRQCKQFFYIIRQLLSDYRGNQSYSSKQSTWQLVFNHEGQSEVYTGLLDGKLNYRGQSLTYILQKMLGIEQMLAFGPVKGQKDDLIRVTEKANVTYLPNHEHLNQTIKGLKDCVLSLSLKRDHQLYVENKILEIRYTLELGPAEYRAIQAAMQLERIVKKYTLIQEQIVNGEPISLPKIDEQLSQSYAYQEDYLSHKLKRLNQAIVFQREYGLENFVEQVSTLDELYCKISIHIHPDLFPNLASEVQELYQNALIAYHQGDVFTLNMIATIVSNQNVEQQNTHSFADLFAEQKRLHALKDLIKEELVQLDDEYPSALKQYVDTQEQVTTQRDFLNEQADESLKAIQDYQAKIDILLK